MLLIDKRKLIIKSRKTKKFENKNVLKRIIDIKI